MQTIVVMNITLMAILFCAIPAYAYHNKRSLRKLKKQLKKEARTKTGPATHTIYYSN